MRRIYIYYISFIGAEFSIPPGTDPAGETQLIIETNKKSYFQWKGYGLKLHIPENALPPGVHQCTLAIRALLFGQFRLPPNCILASSVYQIKAPVNFDRPVTLEIQHCSSFDSTAHLSFVVAYATSEPLYRFEKLVFPSNTSYGSISLDHFCFIGIIQWLRGLVSPRTAPLLQYCAQLYRIYQQNPVVWGLHFVITKDLHSQITVRSFRIISSQLYASLMCFWYVKLKHTIRYFQQSPFAGNKEKA